MLPLEFIREHLLEDFLVRVADDHRFPELPFSLRGLLGQYMAFIRLAVQDFFLRRDLEPLLGSLVGS